MLLFNRAMELQHPTGLINRYRNINSVYNQFIHCDDTVYYQRNISAIVTVFQISKKRINDTADVNLNFTPYRTGIPIKVNVLLTGRIRQLEFLSK
jgi:hypothetical protein